MFVYARGESFQNGSGIILQVLTDGILGKRAHACKQGQRSRVKDIGELGGHQK